MFIKMEDAVGDVCVNMDTGLRVRPQRDSKTGVPAGILIIFPDGHTSITTRGEYDALCKHLDAVDAR